MFENSGSSCRLRSSSRLPAARLRTACAAVTSWRLRPTRRTLGTLNSPAYPLLEPMPTPPFGQVRPYAGGYQGGDTSVLIQDRDFSASNGNPYRGGRLLRPGFRGRTVVWHRGARLSFRHR
jgi:hypothetical protein